MVNYRESNFSDGMTLEDIIDVNKYRPDINHYNELEKKLKHDKQWNNLCYFEEELYNFCIKSKKLIFMPSLILDSNYLHVYRSIRSGDIIFLNDDLTKDGLSFVLTQIRFNGLEILPLSLLLSESR